MSKLFFLILLGVVVYLLLKRAQRPSRARRQAPPAAERMIQCAHCRIHVPFSESVFDGSARYCSEEHRRLARK